MKIVTLALALLLTACGSVSVQDFTPQDKYKDFTPTSPVEPSVEPLPPMPKLKIKDISNTQYAVLDLEGVNQLMHYRSVSEHYAISLAECYSAFNEQVERESLALIVLRAEEDRGNRIAYDLHKLRAEHERTLRGNSIEVFSYRATLIAAGLLFLL